MFSTSIVRCRDRSPKAEAGEGRGGVAQRRVVIIEFIVDLPGADMGITSIAFSKGRCDASCFLQIRFAGETVVPSGSESADSPVGADRQDFRALIDEPFRGCRGRSAKHYLETGLAKRSDRIVKPAPLELVTARLDGRPGKIADADPLQA